MSIEITLPVGRLVGGHPMKRSPNLDKKTHQPLFWKDGTTPSTTAFIAVAIPKAGETTWSETEWGQLIVAEAFTAWPNGEHQYPDFAWKIVDGDSTIPGKPYKGKPGKIPAQSEGYPGHWILKMSDVLNKLKCYHLGKYSPHEQIQNQNEIKPGDYCRIVMSVKGNGPVSESPGMYLNPELFELSRAGQLIQLGDGPDAQAAFGGSAPVLPANAQLTPEQPGMPTPDAPAGMPTPGAPVPTPPTQRVYPAKTPSGPESFTYSDGSFGTKSGNPVLPPAPHPGILQPQAPPEPQYDVNGTIYSKTALVEAGYTDQHFATMTPF